MTQPPAQTIWIARHGTRIDMINPAWPDTAQRPFDPHLADQGHAEAECLAQRLADEPIDAVYASPFLRALQTAAPIARATGAPLRIEPGICEWLNSEWFTCVPEVLPNAKVNWTCEHLDTEYRSPDEMRFPETWEQLAERAARTIRRLAATGQNLVLIGHGSSVIGTVAALLGRVAEDGPPAPPTSLYKLVRYDDQWKLELEADTSHLKKQAD